MKKVLAILAVVLLTAGSASAMPIALNPNAVFGSYGQTGVFDQLGTNIETVSTDYGDDTFTDVGNFAVSSLIELGTATPVSADAGLNDDWYLVGGWSDLAGTTEELVAPDALTRYTYTSGTLNLYATTDLNVQGTKVATLSLTSGFGMLDLLSVPVYDDPATPVLEGASGHYNLSWEFTYLAPGFWLDQNGTALSLADIQADGSLLGAMAIGDTSDVIVVPGANDIKTINSTHNGSVSVGVVPEPATMALLGTGLLGLAGAGIRRKKA